MKRFFLTILVILALFPVLSLASSAEATETYTVRAMGDGYRLYRGDALLSDASDVRSLIEKIPSGSVHFDSVTLFTSLDIPAHDYVFSGEVKFLCDAGVSVRTGSALEMRDMSIDMQEGCIEVMGGELSIIDSTVTSKARSAVTVGERGDSYLFVGGDSRLRGGEYGVYSDVKIIFGKEDCPWESKEEMKIKIMKSGDFVLDFLEIYGENQGDGLEIYDNVGNCIKVCQFEYLYPDGERIVSLHRRDDFVPLRVGKEISGYDFIGWRFEDGSAAAEYLYAMQDYRLYAEYALGEPTFTLESIEKTYDGEACRLRPRELYHPLMAGGEFHYYWYFDGELLSCDESLPVRDVSDSGEYLLVVAFTDGSAYSLGVSVCEVRVHPRVLPLIYADNEFTCRAHDLSCDIPDISTYELDGCFHARIDDDNFTVQYEPVKIRKRGVWYIPVGLSALIASAFSYLRKKRRAVKFASCDEGITSSPIDTARKDTVNMDTVERSFTSVDASRADVLITDRLARALVDRRRDVIITDGYKRCVIYLDEINDAFSSGDTVDINALKRCGLVDERYAYLKIAARGVIDKPLTVRANSFSLTAVKMIALSGGKAEVVKTKRNKK